MAKVHWPPMNKFACKLHGYIVYFILITQFQEKTIFIGGHFYQEAVGI